MTDSRAHILNRLRHHDLTTQAKAPVYQKPLGLSKAQRIKSFTDKQQAVRGEVVLLKGSWTDWMDKHFKNAHLLVGTGELADQANDLKNTKAISHYDQPIESWKPDLFDQIDVSITTSHAGLAESGTLILKPTPQAGGKSAPVFLMTPEGIGVDVATRIAFSKSIALRNTRAPRCKTPSSCDWNVINDPRPDIGARSPSIIYSIM